MSETVHNQLCLAMLGKTGHGKSSSANTILQNGAQKFDVKCQATSVTKNVRYEETRINEEAVYVFDTPGEAFEAGDYERDKGKTESEVKFNDLERTIKYIETLLDDSRSKGDVSAFLMVYPIYVKFTEEEKSTFDTYRKVLGQNVFSDYGIIVLTYGDNFEREMKHSNVKLWCESQAGLFKDLYNEFKQRVVLMYNTTKDKYKEQRQKGVDEIIRYARQIKSERRPYTWGKYDLASQSRRDIYLAYESLTLTPGYNKTLENLRSQLSKLKGNVTDNGRNELLIQIGILRGRIEEKRDGRPLFKDLLNSLNSLEQCVPIVPKKNFFICPIQ